jgi:hypothetical protein
MLADSSVLAGAGALDPVAVAWLAVRARPLILTKFEPPPIAAANLAGPGCG